MKKADKCHKCLRRAEHRLVDKWYCSRCFSELIEQKIKKNLRECKIRKDSKIFVSNPASEYILKKVINLPVRITRNIKSADYHVIDWTIDDENELFLQSIFNNKLKQKKETGNKTGFSTKSRKREIKLFRLVSKDALQTYFRIKKILFTVQKTEINKMLDAFEEKYPGTKSSLMKSEEKIRALS